MILSPKQLELVKHALSNKTVCLAGGATRSGKSTATIFSFGSYVLDRLDREHVIAGYTLESLSRNILPDLLNFFSAAGYKAQLNHLLGTKIQIAYGNRQFCRVWCLGANDNRAKQRLQGATISGAFVDESVIVPEDLWHMLQSRLTYDDSKVWATYNPFVPHHWFKEKVEDRIDQLNGVHYKFSFDDNPFLTPRVKQQLEASLVGPWHDWLVKGEWAGALGRVYTKWNTGLHELGHTETVFGIDWGVATMFAALRCDMQDGKGNMVDEYGHDGGSADTLTDTEHAERFHNWANKPGAKIYIDPSASPSFKRLLREYGYRVINARNELDFGLRHTAEMLGRGRLRISPDCGDLLKEMNSYTWDERESEKDRDLPLKRNDHYCYAMRYIVHSAFHDIFGKNISTREAGF